MGQHSLSTDPDLHFDHQQWIEAVEDTATTRFPNVNPYRKRLLMHKLNSQLIEQYEVQFLNQSDFAQFLLQLEQRKEVSSQQRLSIYKGQQESMKNCPHIYKVRHFKNLSVEEMCSTIYSGLLYINKVDVRLKEVNDIPLQDQLYLYQACLHGFKVLYEKVGVFEITEQMIFFDKQGRVRVWMNPNLSKFQPNYQPEDYNNLNYIQFQGSQSQMIKNLINIIEGNTDRQSVQYCLSFKDYLKDNNSMDRLSFSKTIQHFESYLNQERLVVNRCMQSIRDLYHPEQSDLKSSRQVSQIDFVHFRRQNTNTVNQLTPPISKQSSHQMVSKAVQKNGENQLPFPQLRQPEIKNKLYPIHRTPSFKTDTMSNPNQFSQQAIHNKTWQNQRSALTFNPHIPGERPNRINVPPFQPSNNQSALIRYRSLDKSSTLAPFTSNKNITFSYQKKQSAINIGKQNQRANFLLVMQNQEKQRKQSIIDGLITPNLPSTLKNIESSRPNQKADSAASVNSRDKQRLNYYTSDSEYLLDQEIAEDMLKYLSFNPNTK